MTALGYVPCATPGCMVLVPAIGHSGTCRACLNAGRPGCMSIVEYEAWRTADRATSARVYSPCVDCTLAFARSMRLEGRCDGEPGRVGRGTGPARYATEEERQAARRESWRRTRERQRNAAKSRGPSPARNAKREAA